MRTYYVCLILCCACSATGQNYDKQWLFGADFYSGVPDLGLSVLDFNNGIVTTNYWSDAGYDIGPEGSFICNNLTGEINLYTNGCYVWNQDQESLTDEATLLDDWASPLYCPKEYPAYLSSILLPSLNDDTTYFLLQKNIVFSEALNTLVSSQLVCHEINILSDGTMYVLNTEVLINIDLTLGHLTAGPNRTLDGWWIIVSGFNTNTYYTFELGGQNAQVSMQTTEIGDSGNSLDWGAGQAAYSPDMSTLANNTTAYGVVLIDFDNETGELSNYRNITYPNMDSAEGLCFSPNGRYIYVTTAEDIYQIDLEATDTTEQVFHLSYVRFPSPIDNFPVGLGYMYLGPDCRIYISPGTVTEYLHVIHEPDQYRLDCILETAAIQTPTHIGHHLPNLPNYRYLSSCDETIGWGISVNTQERIENSSVNVFPNPASTFIVIEKTIESQEEWALYDTLGREVKKVVLQQLREQIDLGDLPAGSYYWKMSVGKNRGHLVVL